MSWLVILMRVCTLLLLAVILTEFPEVRAQESKAGVLAATIEQISTIESISVEYTVTHSAEPNSVVKYEWARSGNRGRWAQKDPDDTTTEECYDEKNYFSVLSSGKTVSANIFDCNDGGQRLVAHT